MAYLMDDNAMRICIRPRPWNDKELPHLAQHTPAPFFLGDGNFSAARKPLPGGAIREIVEVIDNRQIDFDKPEAGSETKRGAVGGRRYKNRRYVFDHVFKMEATQEQVYQNTAKPLLDGVLKGYNATVFAYGATGCGKTHTISGHAEDPGVIVRTMSDLFELIEESKDQYETQLEVLMVEIYNETIRDLLHEEWPAPTPAGGLKLLENEKERVTIAEVTIHTPKSVDDVMRLVLLGNERRSTSFTESNSVSSRSHAVLQINVSRKSKSPDVDMDNDAVLQDSSSATLSIIDLAGSERAAATRNMGDRMKEGANINKSLLALSSCISALCGAQRNGSKPHVPYRNSKLTRLLKFSLGGNCRTVMIVCVSPSSKDMEDTSNTLVWADRAKSVKMTVSRNTAGTHVSARQYVQLIAELREQNKLLEKRLKDNDGEESASKKRKREEAQRKAAEAMEMVRSRVAEGQASIEEGAELRAKWDASKIAVSYLESRRSEIESDEDCVDRAWEERYLTELLSKQTDAFDNNRLVQTTVQKEEDIKRSLETLFTQTIANTFTDPDDPILANVSLQVDVHRARVAASVHEARIKGYRAALGVADDALARGAVAFARLQALVQQQQSALVQLVESGISDPETLRVHFKGVREATARSEMELANIFGSLSRYDGARAPAALPPTPSRHAADASMSTFRNNPKSPARKRIMKVIEGKGGFERGLVSPRKPVLAKGLREPTRTFRARFGDDTGEGELKQVFNYRPRGSQSPSFEIETDDDSTEWEEMKDDLKALPVPAPPALATSPVPAPFSVLPPAPPSTSASTSMPPPSASGSSMDVDMPEWKKNRILMGKGGSSALGGENLSASPQLPEADSKHGGVGLGRPGRMRPSTGPLGELRQLPTAPRASLSASNLMKPTAASAARSSGSELTSSPGSGNRRLSLRHDRKKLHSNGPYSRPSGPSLIPSPVGSPADPAVPGAPATAGVRRAMAAPRGRASSLAPLQTLAAESSSAGAAGATLKPRPSMQRLGGGENKPQPWK
ncbi:tubulin-dependent ATPase kip3 [Vanrija albida]|uniref:Tubulin-dependent ATPase kip3 n=1 Tax=Vanrija albida TaxID=181172 RepID=A0ABR3PSM9_9TREE